MCRRLSISANLSEIEREFGIEQVLYPYQRRFNISPTQMVPAIRELEGRRVLDEYRWGMVPFWGKDSLNADIYSIHTNSAYWKLTERQRCIIPCSGLYYWRQEGKKSYPVHVVLRKQGIFGVAGLYEVWRDAQGRVQQTCTLLMARSNELIAEFETRMPAILDPEEADAWLRPVSTEIEALARQLRPYTSERMRLYPVTSLIENEQYDHSDCIQELDVRLGRVKA
ncbi:SOS response-associated peptidase [Paenibacillus alvei]|uniref:SOS response-associated peptidase n=1 Tax=Paenibacillus alvei TaxID=44250 RepID=UPI002281C318|nr:SOS response-associated peptidase [Paenibacillus alvei]